MVDTDNITFPSEKENMLKVVIGELLELTKSLTVKKVIGAYSYAKAYSTNLEKLKALPSAQLEECAQFLKLTVRNSNNVKAYKNKEILADWIIMKIESHYEELCDECGKTYRNKLDGPEPYLRCYLCMQGCHDCEDISARFESSSQEISSHLTGTVWLCRGCRVKNSIFCVTKIPKVDPDSTAPSETESKEKSEDNVSTEIGVPRNGRPSPRRDHSLGQEENNAARQDRNRDESRNKDHDATKPEICPLYKKRQCPHGASGQNEIDGKICSLPHPRKCLKFCRFGKRKGGCTKGRSCEYYHPVLCKYSVKSNRCSNTECTYTHLKGTKRPKSEPSERMEIKSHYRAERERFGRTLRWRKDSTVSTGSRTSESYRTPSNRKRTSSESERQKPPTVPPPRPNDFLEKLMENMRKGFEEQKVEIGLMKQGLDHQIEALWKQVGSISQTSLPQLPPFVHQQLQPNMMPTAQSQGPWNMFQNQYSMY